MKRGILSSLNLFLALILASAVSLVSPQAAVADGYELFVDSGQSLGSSLSRAVALGDLDGDSDLDVFIGNYNQPNKVWLNDGTGTFSESQSLDISHVHDAALGDVDGDGDLDAFVVALNQANEVWLNDGTGIFTDSGQALGDSASVGLAMGDIDNDGDLDAFVANAYGQANKVWLNDRTGTFTESQSLGSSDSIGVALGDLDGDGDLDAFVTNFNGQANRVWLNDGAGTFSDSGQALGNSDSRTVALGDLDGDGDLDALVTNEHNQANKIWLNNGTGIFTETQSLGSSESRTGALGDLDGDGDLDAFVANMGDQANKVWLNNGTATFTEIQSLGNSSSFGLALGDMDGDGDLDAFVGNYGQPNKVWLNTSSTNLPPTASAGGPYSVDEGGSVVLTASGSDPDGDPLTYAWDLDNDGSFETPGQSVTFSAAGLDGPSSHTISVQVTDSGGLSATDQTTVEVLNVAPTVDAGPDATIIEGDTFSGTGTFTDPGADIWTATVDYDNGSGVQPLMLTGNTFDLSHVYADAGTYTVTVTVTDDDGGEGSDTLTMTVLTSEEAVEEIIDTVESFNLQQGIDNSLDAKLDAALQALGDLNDNNDVAAVNALEAFINAVEAQRGNKLTDAQADELVERAQAVIDSLS